MRVARGERPRRTQAERSAESARRLMQAAIELGSEQGFDRTTITDICRRAGYSKAMVRERYGSKEELLRAILESEFEAWMAPRPTPDMTGLQEALAHVTAFRRAAIEQPKTLRAFCVLCYETTGPMPELADWMTAALRRYRASVAKALRRGQRDGSVRPDLDTARAARQFTTYVLGCGLQWSLQPRLMSLRSELRLLHTQLQTDWCTADLGSVPKASTG